MIKKILLDFFKSVLAGLSIGLGGLLFVLSKSIPWHAFITSVLGSLLFAVGLFLVCTFRFNLYTGKIGNVYEAKQEKYFYLFLPLMLIGNCIGASGFGLLMNLVFSTFPTIRSAYEAVAASKIVNYLTSDVSVYFMTLLKAMGCGFFVYMAVKSFNLARLKPVGIILLVTFVFMFVYFGLEHCIANMFYFAFSHTLNWSILINLLIVILGNSIGVIPGVLFFKLVSKTNKTA